MDDTTNHNTRPKEPEHPQILDGGVVDGDPAFMLHCLAEDYLNAGTTHTEIDRMSRDPFYQALYAAREAVGDEMADTIIERAACRSSAMHIKVWESTALDVPVDLTVSRNKTRNPNDNTPTEPRDA